MGAWTKIDDKYIGLGLAIASSFMIGMSSIITKKGLIDAAQEAAQDDEYGGGGASSGVLPAYLSNYIWWAGMITMVIGEIGNFAAYIFAPPILVAPLGGMSVILAAILASFLLKEELGRIGRAACTLCLLGSTIIVLHAPEDNEIETVDEILRLAMRPVFICYTTLLVLFSFLLIYRYCPIYGQTNPVFYITICSIYGSLSVMAIKGLGVAINLTVKGNNQLSHLSFWVFAFVSALCIAVQMNYFNKALDTFHTNIVNPIYYVMFSTATIFASLILNQGFNTTGGVNTLSLLCGFLIIFIGVYLLVTSRIEREARELVGYSNPNSPTTNLYHGGDVNRQSAIFSPQTGRFSNNHGGAGGGNRHSRMNSASYLERGIFNPRISIDQTASLLGGRDSLSLDGVPPHSATAVAVGEVSPNPNRRLGGSSHPGTPRGGGAGGGGGFPFRDPHRKTSSLYRTNSGNNSKPTTPAHQDVLFEFPEDREREELNQNRNGNHQERDRDQQQPFSVGLDIDDEDDGTDDGNVIPLGVQATTTTKKNGGSGGTAGGRDWNAR